MKIKNILYILLISIFLNGCISVTKELPAFTTYTIKTDKNIQTNKNLPYSLEIKEPKALSSINSKQISYFAKDNISEKYALSKWSDSPTKLIQKAMVDYLSSTNNYAYVNSSNVNVRNDYKIVSQLDNFNQYIKENESFVQLSIKIYLKKDGEIFFKNFTYEQKSINNAKQSVNNLNILVNKFVSDLDTWLLSKIN